MGRNFNDKIDVELQIPHGLDFRILITNGRMLTEDIKGSPVSMLKFALEIIEQSGRAVLTEKNPHYLSDFLETYRKSLIDDLEKIKNSSINLQKILLSDEFNKE